MFSSTLEFTSEFRSYKHTHSLTYSHTLLWVRKPAKDADWLRYVLCNQFPKPGTNFMILYLPVPECKTRGLNRHRYLYKCLWLNYGLPRWLSGKESACSAGDTGDVGSIPGSGRSLGGGSGNPLQYSRLENSMDTAAWQAAAHGVLKSQTRLSTHTHMQEFIMI